MSPRSIFFLASAALLGAVAATGHPAAPAAAAAPSSMQGQRLFLRCASCHAIAVNAPAKIGPNLNGVVGRKAGAMHGYAYSPAMMAKSFAWDEPTLDRWLAQPSSVVPGTSMAFAGLSNPQDRKALIAYLKKNGS